MQTIPIPSAKKKGQNLSKSIYSPAESSRRQKTVMVGPSRNSVAMITTDGAGARDDLDFFDMPRLIAGSGRQSYREPTPNSMNNLRYSVSPNLQSGN
jgi:hypothetical protein